MPYVKLPFDEIVSQFIWQVILSPTLWSRKNPKEQFFVYLPHLKCYEVANLAGQLFLIINAISDVRNARFISLHECKTVLKRDTDGPHTSCSNSHTDKKAVIIVSLSEASLCKSHDDRFRWEKGLCVSKDDNPKSRHVAFISSFRPSLLDVNSLLLLPRN